MPISLHSSIFRDADSHSLKKKIPHSQLSSQRFSLPIGIEIIIPSVPIFVSIVTPPNCERHRHHSFNMAGTNDDHSRSHTSFSSHSSSSVSILPTESLRLESLRLASIVRVASRGPIAAVLANLAPNGNATEDEDCIYFKFRMTDDEWNLCLQDP